MTIPTRTVSVTRDDEHNVFALQIEDRSLGYPRQYEIGIDFIMSGEYRTLVAAYREIADIKFPAVVVSGESPREEEPQEETEETTQEDGAGRSCHRPPGRSRKEPDVTLQSLDDFVEFFISAGKKGIAINRYKGLGEMNPDTLWNDDDGSGEPDAVASPRRGSRRSRSDVHDIDG